MPVPSGPIIFEPLFFERIWGGRNLEIVFGKKIPAQKPIGESWEIVDRPEAQSMAQTEPYRGRSLHDLWVNEREAIFGQVAGAPRFPLLIKLLDCCETLSLQVHPPVHAAEALGSESKAEFWHIANAQPDAKLFLGIQAPTDADEFRRALQAGNALDLINRLPAKTGDSFFIPSGRVHAIGAGNLIIEIQQNSDTTYRIFDWNRRDAHGRRRDLHIEQALQCINFDDSRAKPINPNGESLLANNLFAVERWEVAAGRELTSLGQFAIACCLSGTVRCGELQFAPGQFFLLPAEAKERVISSSSGKNALLLRITIPK